MCSFLLSQLGSDALPSHWPSNSGLEGRKDFQEDASSYPNYIIRDGVGIFPVGCGMGAGEDEERGW